MGDVGFNKSSFRDTLASKSESESSPQKLQSMSNKRAVYSWVSEINGLIALLHIWTMYIMLMTSLKNFFSQSEIKSEPIMTCLHFSVLCVSYMYASLQTVLIGLDCI